MKLQVPSLWVLAPLNGNICILFELRFYCCSNILFGFFLIFVLCSFFFHKYFKNAGRKAKYRPVLDFVLSQPNLAKQVSSFLKQRLLYKKFLFVKQSKKKKEKTILFPYLLWVKLKCCDTCYSNRLYLGDINSRSTEMHSH